MIPDGLAPLWYAVHTGGALLFSVAFLYLWRQSGVVYFGLWAAAWAADAVSLLLGAGRAHDPGPAYLSAYAALKFAMVVALWAGARAGFSGTIRGWRPALKTLAGVPVFIVAGVALPLPFAVGVAVLLAGIYVYHFTSIRGGAGPGASVFRASLLGMAAVSLYYSAALWLPAGDPWALFANFARFAFSAVLTFGAMAMWVESQSRRVRELNSELDRVRRESLLNLDLDRLTGLLNQTALSRRMEETGPLEGVVAVCDMDDFKEINDRYGHLTGDEILRNIGHLLRASIRQEDEAFRWGGDEFVILFHNQDQAVARARMGEIQRRLQGFRVRGHGMLPITFSWGTAESAGRPLREVLDEADRNMYAFKRGRKA